MLARAAEQIASRFRQTVKRAVLAVDPRDAEKKHADARDERRVVFQAQPDGMASMWAYGSAEDIETIRTAVQVVADKLRRRAAEALLASLDAEPKALEWAQDDADLASIRDRPEVAARLARD